jgi:HlyD family secretion protein
MKTSTLFWTGAILAVVGGLGFAAVELEWMRPEEEESIDGALVRKGSLRISETVRGNLEARNAVVLRSEIERGTTILYLIDEGAQVKPGDLVCELDVSELEDRQVEQEITVNRAEASLTKAEEQYAIQEIQNRTDLAQAELQLRFGKMDLEKYVGREGATIGEDDLVLSEWQHELQKLDETILLREQELTQSSRDLEFTRELVGRNFAAQQELVDDEIAYERARVALGQARREKALTMEYNYERKLQELQEEIETRQRDLEKTDRQARAKMADFEAEVESARFTLQREEERLAKILEQIEKSRIISPAEGIVVYARERSRWGSGDPIQEGTEVRERQDIVTIPQPGGMVAEAKLHETSLKKVTSGQKCLVRIDAQPGKVFEGRVSFVATLPDSGSYWSNPNQRVYRSEVVLEEGNEDMRPGMSCSIEILVDDLDDVTYVPRQCVFFDGRSTVAFVLKDDAVERREVEVGLDNAQWVEVKSGLSEGEKVAMAPPADFKPEAPSAGAPPDGPRAERVEGAGGAAGAGGGRPSGMPAGAMGGGRSMGMGSTGSGGRPSGMGAGAGGSGRADAARGASAGGGRPSGAGRPSGEGRGAGGSRPSGGGRPSGGSAGGK